MFGDQTILLDQLIVQNPGSIVSDMDGETVMMNIQNGKYYNLGRIGGKIWGVIVNPMKVQEVIAELVSEYDVEQSECEEQVLSFLHHLYAEGLIDFADGENNELNS